MSDEETEAAAAEDVDEPQDDDEEVGTDATDESEADETEGTESEVAESEETESEEAESEAAEEDADASDAGDDAEDAGGDGGDGGDDDVDGLQDGDFIELSYTAYTVEDEQLVDTTSQEVAEEEGVGDQGTFEPRTIILGAGHLFEVVEDAIVGHEVGHADTVVVPAAEAFGEYDQEKVRTVSADKIDEDDRYPGAQLQIDGEQGYLETIIGGRARVDFNHPLAGDDIEYEFEVLEVVEDKLEQAQGLLNMFLDMDLEMHIETDEVEEERLVERDEDEEAEADDADDEEAEADEAQDGADSADEDSDEEPESEPEFETVTVEKETLYIEATPQLSFNQQWLFQKQQIAQEIIDRIGLDRIVIEEIIDGSGGMPGMMGGMGGMMGGAGGAEGGDIEAALEDADVDEEELLEELDADIDEE